MFPITKLSLNHFILSHQYLHHSHYLHHSPHYPLSLHHHHTSHQLHCYSLPRRVSLPSTLSWPLLLPKLPVPNLISHTFSPFTHFFPSLCTLLLALYSPPPTRPGPVAWDSCWCEVMSPNPTSAVEQDLQRACGGSPVPRHSGFPTPSHSVTPVLVHFVFRLCHHGKFKHRDFLVLALYPRIHFPSISRSFNSPLVKWESM